MDTNPRNFPFLSYVISRMGGKPLPDSSVVGREEVDVEQPSPMVRHQEQMEKEMPHLSHPKVLGSMSQAISEVAQTRAILQILGPRSNHEVVDAARAKIVEIDDRLSKQLEGIVLEERPDGVDRLNWRTQQAEREMECRQEAEREKSSYEALLQLEDMHSGYEKLLREAEDKLVKIYGSAEDGSLEDPPEVKEETDEKVVSILQEAVIGALDRVELSGREIRFLPEAFGRLRGLRVLNLSNNLLEAVPDSIAGLESLEELWLSSNLLVSLPDSIGLLLNLKILDVSGNKLKALPDSISHCRSLVELNASYNGLTYLPTNIGLELMKLQKLLIHLNKLRSLPSSICEMRSLRHLDAHFNELCGLPLAIGRLTNLEILNISSNFSDLTEIPNTIGDLMDLKELDLSNNQIHALPDTFGRLDKLIKLNLDQNPLVIPPMEVVNRGVDAVKDYMAERWLEVLVAEEERSVQEADQQSQVGWLTRSSSWLNNWASSVSENVAGYMGTGAKSQRDPYLDQQL